MNSERQPSLCVDLHCHSTYSDGVLAPSALAERAATQGVDVWALTDHDEVSGIALARAAAVAQGVRFVAGVEISVTWGGRTVHVVGLGIDEGHPVLLEGLTGTRAGRAQRARDMAAKFDALGVSGTFEGALGVAGNADLISRTHFARHLLHTGHVQTLQAAFDRYLRDDGPAFVPMQWATLAQAVEWIRTARGVAVIAHPGRYKYSRLQFDALFSEFKDLGGLAIEVNTGSHHPEQYAQYASVARRFGFMASCGSDFHAPQEGRCDLGQVQPLASDLRPVWDVLDIGQS